MHAVNNLAGFPRFSAGDWFQESKHDKDEDGNFDTGTVEKMLQKHFGRERVTMSNKLSLVFQNLGQYLGFVVLTEQEKGHYVSFRQDDHGWLFFNSLAKDVYRLKNLQFLKDTVNNSCKSRDGEIIFCDTYMVLKKEEGVEEEGVVVDGVEEEGVEEEDVDVEGVEDVKKGVEEGVVDGFGEGVAKVEDVDEAEIV